MTKEGTVLDGKYEIWKEVGRGGMSIVYLARDNRLNKQWAVKEIKNDGKKDITTLLKALEREANILKNVDHPVLPRIVDIINQDEIIYVVMDFIEGTTISNRLKKEGAQPQELVIEWGIQLASALDYLHNMNPPIIYRDMKPSNVMIRPEGGVKLIDFGTAKEYEIEDNADTTALGTRGYAAPEQFGDSKGRGIYNTDARTDIYNLGATLYHIVTGMNPCEPPYEMKPIREWNPELSSGLEKIILKCTQPNPEDRYQNCAELMYALEHYDELDDAHKRSNKLKLHGFIASVTFMVIGGLTSLFGYNKMNEIKLENYNSYIEEGDEDRVEGDLVKAAEDYKHAFELDGRDSEAYEKFIQTYIDGYNMIDEEGNRKLELETGLTVVTNRIKAGYDGVNKNDAVLYKVAMAYFIELSDYKMAHTYFNKIDEEDKDYGEIAKYYRSVSLILSSANYKPAELMDEVGKFADYNMSAFNNQNIDKFINYKIIGKIYAGNATYGEVAEKAETVMEQALHDLEEYNGKDIDVNDYYFAYYDNLTSIYETIIRNIGDDDTNKTIFVSKGVNACEEYLNILTIKVENDANNGIGGTNDNVYNTSYYNKMMKKAFFYSAIDKYDDVIATYEEAEKIVGKDNVFSNKVYANHLDYIYTFCERKHQDPTTWIRTCNNELSDLLKVYEEGCSVSDINSSKTWNRRKDVLEMLSSGGSLGDKPDTNIEESDTEKEINEGMEE